VVHVVVVPPERGMESSPLSDSAPHPPRGRQRTG
jgi:hypothetical protein